MAVPTFVDRVTLHVNGAVSVADYAAQMPRNAGYNGQGATKRHEAYRTRPTATKAQDERRRALDTKWAEVIERGLAALEQEQARYLPQLEPVHTNGYNAQ